MIALYRGKSLASRLIRACNWSDYSHAAWVDEQAGGRTWEAWRKGVTCARDISENHTPGTTVELYHVPMTHEARLRVRDFLLSQQGKGYDWSGALSFITRPRRRQNNQDRWFCSELVFEAFRAGGINLLMRIPAHKVYPGLLAYSPLLAHVKTVQTGSPK